MSSLSLVTAAAVDGGVTRVRAFNRFYTRLIGVLHPGLHESPFALTESRVLYELAHRDGPSATELAADLGLDPGYLSRLLAGLGRRGLVERERSGADARRRTLRLTRRGRTAFAGLDIRAQGEVRAMLDRLSPGDRDALLAGMGAIEAALGLGAGAATARQPVFVLRGHEPGDIGWVVQRHGVIYAREQGWDARFEALVARIAADFVDRLDPSRERCWIAERGGERVGSVFLVKRSARVAQLRLLLIEPSARGLGLGHRLVEECTRFARRAGYARIRLWTNGKLAAAVHTYQRAGYRLVSEDPGEHYGDQIWELRL
jgi:DNA-binding MarR family transcriptional regulator/GNAT superfamily N-acetyltransferase